MTDNAENAGGRPDVLNSIRQLMAERESQSLSGGPRRDKLVLTDAQRVSSASRAKTVADEVDRIARNLSRSSIQPEQITPEKAVPQEDPTPSAPTTPSLLSALKSAVEAPAATPATPTAALDTSDPTTTTVVPSKEALAVTPKAPAKTPAITLDDKIAALEKILGTQRPKPEPTPEASVPQQPVEPKGASNVIRLVHSTDAPAVSGAVTHEELREMVAEILRAELQGVLGEKITGNMRKMVRREIQRAIMDRDLD